MRAISQRPAGVFDSKHPSIEVSTLCSAVTTDTGFTKWKVSNILLLVEKSPSMCISNGERHGLLLHTGAARETVLTMPIFDQIHP